MILGLRESIFGSRYRLFKLDRFLLLNWKPVKELVIVFYSADVMPAGKDFRKECLRARLWETFICGWLN